MSSKVLFQNMDILEFWWALHAVCSLIIEGIIDTLGYNVGYSFSFDDEVVVESYSI